MVRGLGVYARAGNQHKHTQWSTLPGDPAARTMPRAAKLLTSAWLPQGIAPKMVRANSEIPPRLTVEKKKKSNNVGSRSCRV